MNERPEAENEKYHISFRSLAGLSLSLSFFSGLLLTAQYNKGPVCSPWMGVKLTAAAKQYEDNM